MIDIQNERMKFVQLCYCGNREDVFSGVVDKSYRDFCRVLRGFGSSHKEGKERARFFLINSLKQFFNSEHIDFDSWHKDTMYSLIELFDFPKFTLGTSQKWINMSFKYLYCLYDIQTNLRVTMPLEKFNDCHCPIDNVIIHKLKDYNITLKSSCTWSQLTDYSDYIHYQKSIRDLAAEKKMSALDLELLLWQ